MQKQLGNSAEIDDLRLDTTMPLPDGSDPVVLSLGRAVRVPLLNRLVLVSRIQLGLFLIALNLTDVLVTKAILARGGVEGNPLMRNMMTGFAAPLGTKVAIAATAAVLLMICPSGSRLADRAAATVVGVYLAIVAWNCALLGYLSF